MDNGARSPDGALHPGEIVNEDKIENRTWTHRADEVPSSAAWVDADGAWIPVVRIEITGSVERREITKFGPGGKMLENTVQAPRPQRSTLQGAAPAPVPVPAPAPPDGGD